MRDINRVEPILEKSSSSWPEKIQASSFATTDSSTVSRTAHSDVATATTMAGGSESLNVGENSQIYCANSGMGDRQIDQSAETMKTEPCPIKELKRNLPFAITSNEVLVPTILQIKKLNGELPFVLTSVDPTPIKKKRKIDVPLAATSHATTTMDPSQVKKPKNELPVEVRNLKSYCSDKRGGYWDLQDLQGRQRGSRRSTVFAHKPPEANKKLTHMTRKRPVFNRKRIISYDNSGAVNPNESDVFREGCVTDASSNESKFISVHSSVHKTLPGRTRWTWLLPSKQSSTQDMKKITSIPIQSKKRKAKTLATGRKRRRCMRCVEHGAPTIQAMDCPGAKPCLGRNGCINFQANDAFRNVVSVTEPNIKTNKMVANEKNGDAFANDGCPKETSQIVELWKKRIDAWQRKVNAKKNKKMKVHHKKLNDESGSIPEPYDERSNNTNDHHQQKESTTTKRESIKFYQAAIQSAVEYMKMEGVDHSVGEGDVILV